MSDPTDPWAVPPGRGATAPEWIARHPGQRPGVLVRARWLLPTTVLVTLVQVVIYVWSYYLGNFDPRRVDNYVYGLLQALIAEGLGVAVFAASLGCLIIGRTARRTVGIMGFVVLVAEVVTTFYSFN